MKRTRAGLSACSGAKGPPLAVHQLAASAANCAASRGSTEAPGAGAEAEVGEREAVAAEEEEVVVVECWGLPRGSGGVLVLVGSSEPCIM